VIHRNSRTRMGASRVSSTQSINAHISEADNEIH
jgi:hypothetical protein